MHISKIIQIEIIIVIGGVNKIQKSKSHNSFIDTVIVDKSQKVPHINRQYLIENAQKDLEELTQDKINKVMLNRIRHKTIDTITVFDIQQDSVVNEAILAENKKFKNTKKTIKTIKISTTPKNKVNESVRSTIKEILNSGLQGIRI